MTVTIKTGYALWLRALKTSRFGSLSEAAAWMYRLNVFARSIGRHPLVDQIYELKNKLVRYLYQHGYATEVTLHVQEFECWGTFEDGCGPDCPKCGGTGIHHTTRLYGFRFDIDGQRYAWHQLEKLIDYPVKLTDSQPAPYSEPRRDQAILSLEDAWTGCCVVWWALLLHGVWVSLLLFPAVWHRSRVLCREWISVPQEAGEFVRAIKARYRKTQVTK